MSGHKEFKVRWGMVIDLDKCTGCGACIVACQAENNIPPGQDGTDRLRSLNWLTIFELSNKGHYPSHEVAYLPRPCMQCGNPSCVPVCPATATDKNEEGGIVSQIYPRCFGCRYCMAACPYHARYFNWFDPAWPAGMEKTLTPFTSTRPRGVVEKCNFCHHRYMYAKDKARVEGRDPMKLDDGDYVPACVQACPTGAMYFGDVKNPEHAVHEMIKSPYTFRLLERLGTDPQVYYMSRRKWVRLQGDNYLQEEIASIGEGGGHHG